MKNLEEEYKKSQQEKTPDLWEKIEAALPEKKKFQGRKRLVRYMGLAAAALFICVLIPVIRNLGSGNMINTNPSYNSEMLLDSTDNAALPPKEETEALPDSAAQETDPDLGQNESDWDGLGNEIENSVMQDVGNAESSIFRETLEVSGSTQQGEQTVYTLSAPEGRTYRAVFQGDMEQELQTGESYVFTLNKVEGKDWEYEIQEIE
mgnify:CR=1 FL=1